MPKGSPNALASAAKVEEFAGGPRSRSARTNATTGCTSPHEPLAAMRTFMIGNVARCLGGPPASAMGRATSIGGGGNRTRAGRCETLSRIAPLPRNRPECLGVDIPPRPLSSRPVPARSAGSCDIRATWRGLRMSSPEPRLALSGVFLPAGTGDSEQLRLTGSAATA